MYMPLWQGDRALSNSHATSSQKIPAKVVTFSYLKFRDGGCLAHSHVAAESVGWDQGLGPPILILLSFLMKRDPLLEIKRCSDLPPNGLETVAWGQQLASWIVRFSLETAP